MPPIAIAAPPRRDLKSDQKVYIRFEVVDIYQLYEPLEDVLLLRSSSVVHVPIQLVKNERTT